MIPAQPVSSVATLRRSAESFAADIRANRAFVETAGETAGRPRRCRAGSPR